MGFFSKKQAEPKNFLKPKAMDAFIKGKTDSFPKTEEFLMIKITPCEPVNGTYDKDIYQNILTALKERIAGLLPPEGCFCQLPDDSYLLYVPEKLTESELYEKGWNLITECCGPFDVKDNTVYPEINAGLAVYPDSGKTPEDLTASLTIAVSAAQKEGANTFSVYTPKVTAEKSKEYAQLAELREGVNRNQFLLYYQPVIDAETSRIHGLEALLRWRHPLLGIVSPKDFFDVIEASGEIYQLGLWTFEQMLEQRARWRASYPHQTMVYHMNLSAKQLIHAELSEDIRRIVKKFNGLDPQEICFEISSFTVALKDHTIFQNMAALRKQGFRLALDNFGDAELLPGSLLTLPVDIVKINGNYFTENPNAGPVREALTAAHEKENGIILIAQNIENVETAAHIRQFGVRLLQGFYYSRPVSAEECTAFFAP